MGLGCLREGASMCFEIMSTGTASHEVSLPSCDPFLCREIYRTWRESFS